ncbi:MAG TPA: hypothetical protein VMW87_04750 [Spirochaetia bacterium]|nr:hypothetical protein [Spirochaetia bacterium]
MLIDDRTKHRGITVGIASIIIGGVIVITLISSFFSYLTEKKKHTSPALESKLDEMEKRLAVLESRADDKDELVAELANDVSFVNKLIGEQTVNSDPSDRKRGAD